MENKKGLIENFDKYRTIEEICFCCRRSYFPSSTPCKACNIGGNDDGSDDD